MAFFHGKQHSFSSPAYRDVLKGIRTKLPANEHHGKVVDIRAGCAGDDGAADLFERVIRVVVLQHVRRAEAERAELAAKLEDSAFVVENFDRLESVNKRLQEIDAEDELLMTRWSELEERREAIENAKQKD